MAAGCRLQCRRSTASNPHRSVFFIHRHIGT